jgi:hypothetical protein
MELNLNDIDCANISTPIRILNPILSIDISKDNAYDLIRKKNNLLTMEWFSIDKQIYIIAMILDCRLKEHLDLINERCNHFNVNFNRDNRYLLFINNELMNDQIHNAVYNRDLIKVIKLRTYKIRKIIEN